MGYGWLVKGEMLGMRLEEYCIEGRYVGPNTVDKRT